MDTALAQFGFSIEQLRAALQACCHPGVPRPGIGFQLDLGPSLQKHLSSSLAVDGIRTVSTRYSSNLNENADLAFGRDYNGPRVFFELEFRPNVEKDLVKFQIGANAGALAAAVLILAADRKCVNPAYTTMPEFAKFARVITELQPTYPLLMLGFRGAHA